MMTLEQMKSRVDVECGGIAHMKLIDLKKANKLMLVKPLQKLSVFKTARMRYDFLKIIGEFIIMPEDTLIIIQGRFLHLYNTYGHLDFEAYCNKLRNDGVFTLEGFASHIAFDLNHEFTEACKKGVEQVYNWIKENQYEQYDQAILSFYINMYQYWQYNYLIRQVVAYMETGDLMFDNAKCGNLETDKLRLH